MPRVAIWRGAAIPVEEQPPEKASQTGHNYRTDQNAGHDDSAYDAKKLAEGLKAALAQINIAKS